MDASKARDDLVRQLNQKSEECDKLNKGLDEAAKSIEKDKHDAKQKLESIIKEKDESLVKIKEESAAVAARSSEELSLLRKEMEAQGSEITATAAKVRSLQASLTSAEEELRAEKASKVDLEQNLGTLKREHSEELGELVDAVNDLKEKEDQGGNSIGFFDRLKLGDPAQSIKV